MARDKEEVIKIIFLDAKDTRWEVEVSKTFRNGYMEFAMVGKGERSSGQNIDRIKPANKYQKELVQYWENYHLKEIDNSIWKNVLNTISNIQREEDKRREEETISWEDINDDKIVALAQHLNMTAEEAYNTISHERGNYYDAAKNTYLVCDDDEANEEAYTYMENSIEEMGFTYINGWEQFIDEKRLARELSMNSYSERDLGYDEPDRYLDEEPEENGDWSEEQRQRAADKAEEEFKDMIEDDPIGYLEDMYGRESEELSKFLEPYVNERDLIEYVIRFDGRGNILNTYDGNEYEETVDGTWYYIYEV